MKRYFTFLVLLFTAYALNAQVSDSEVLTRINNNQKVTATLTSASRLFSDKEDLASVQSVLPIGTTVQVLGLDDTYYRVKVEETEGYIFKRHATIDNGVQTATAATARQTEAQPASVSTTTASTRMVTLLAKYDSKTAKAINDRKIWKGMNTDMVIDSWGNPKKITRSIITNDITEQWSYSTSNLYFHNDILISWGPATK